MTKQTLSRQDFLLKEMKESIGTKEPVEYFDKMADLLGVLFERIDTLESTLRQVRLQSLMAIEWDPHIASNMLADQINKFRHNLDRDVYETEINALKKAFAEDLVTQSYTDFCKFWQDTLGWHPFLDAK